MSSEPHRDPPDWLALARRAAREPGPDPDGAAALEMLVVELAGAPYGIPVERVREIVRVPPVTPVPRVPASVRGVAALRGEVVQVVDLPRRLGLPGTPAGRGTRLVLLHGEGRDAAALHVDAVAEVASLPSGELGPPPARHGPAVCGLARWRGRFVSILDLDEVLRLEGGEG